ncbi:HAMP domain-containing sensor histidine kinase [Devosia neptuniae]|jgi:signal transduction histidine kinase|uniref:ATP-binding protein n=1 Tax=Devosia TaxID=46913 RepID=UPI0022AF3F5A|nr:HAMP domain-containing sensor histidine kinase [Devosia neptuniae]MCZ4344894.1 HAMP domain-containing sensor histidine kinase [Devosia neptuniae]|tara:strand:- start:4775 stop:6148 length:1374 start_codon:yes stop_codon:yes gene_type:complete
MRKGSIAASLFWLSAGWLVVALVATGFLLTDLYSRALDTALSDTLDFHVESLAGSLLETGDPQSQDIALADPRFGRPRSGWYWAIRDADGTLYNLSRSVVGIDTPDIPGPVSASGRQTAIMDDSFGTSMRVVERTVTIGPDTYEIIVTGNLSEILELVGNFRGQAFIVLGAVGVMLAMMSFIVARFAMRPVDRLSAAIESVRAGESAAVTGTYPREIAPLAEEVNELLRSNTQIIERARNQVGNLAHGLKTPIAVLRNEAGTSKGALADVVLAESDKMSTMVTTYLERARLAARTSVVGKKADAAKIMARLSRVMAKIHPDIAITLHPHEPALPWFRGDEADLEEIAGNLLDNACKWSGGQVEVRLSAEQGSAGTVLLLAIDDNGPGLSAEDAQKVLRRGVRLDEKTPGSGLGLDIVKELVDVYGGDLALKRSALGGLLVELRLPTARQSGITRPAT